MDSQKPKPRLVHDIGIQPLNGSAPAKNTSMPASPEPKADVEPVIDTAPKDESIPAETTNSAPTLPTKTPEADLPADPKDDVPAHTTADSEQRLDVSEQMAKQLAQTMQKPKVLDTNTYHVPIKSTHHMHGSPRTAFIVGVLFAAVVLGAIIYFMYHLV